MPVSRKPKDLEVKDNNLEKFINKGGSEPDVQVPVENKKEDKLQSVKLRVPTDLLEEIDHLVASRRPSPSRHQWILEALYEKVDREQEEVNNG